MNKSKQILSLFLAMAMVLSLCTVFSLTVKADALAEISVATVNAEPGDTVNVEVSIAHNPGILGGTMTLTYDSGLTLIGIANGAVFSGLAMTLPGIYTSGCKVLWDAVSDPAKSDGVIMTLTFKVADDATPGKTQRISVSVDDFVDGNVESIGSSVTAGGIAVSGSAVHTHSLTHIDAVAATITTAGNIEYWFCSECGKYFTDAAASNEVALENTVVAPTGSPITTEISVATVNAEPGDTVNVEVSIAHNPGILGGTLTLTYDSGLTLIGIANGAAFSGLAMTLPGVYTSGCKVLWDAVSDTAKSDGVIMTLTFTVASDAAIDEIQKISIDVDDLVDGNVESIGFSVTAGSVIIEHVHQLVKTNAAAATCEVDGNIEYWTCSKCGKLFGDEAGTKEIEKADTIIAALGHIWNDGVVTTSATCEEAGVRTFTCQRDGSHTKTEPVPPTGHDWGEWEVTTAATCSAEGTETRICKNDASHIETRAVAIDTEAHDWGEWTVTKAATEDEEGIETRVCKNDAEHTETRSIPKLDHVHTLVKTAAVAATCTEAGNIEYWTCSKCGRLFSDEAGTMEIEKADTVIPATGHAWGAWTITAAATCTTAGTETRVCQNDASHTETSEIAIDPDAHNWSAWTVTTPATEDAEGVETRVCLNNTDHVETRAIPKLNHVHNLVKTDAVAATCETAGNIAYWTCSKCGKLFSDEAGTTEITAADTVLPALGHEWDDGVVTTAATCTTNGVKTFTCQHDSSHTKTETIPATGHDWGEWTVAMVATCSAEGSEVRVCKNDSSHTESRVIDIDETAHDWNDWVVLEPATEDSAGVEIRTCKNNESHIESRTIPQLPHVHTLVKTEAVAATCTEAGNIEYWKCSKCGKLFSDEAGETEIKESDTVIAALGHEWDDGVVTTAATCTTSGTKTFICQHDSSHTKTETIPATGHSWGDWTVVTAATCSTAGSRIRVCANDASHTETETIPIDENAHDWGEWVVLKEATEDEAGVEVRTCKNNAEHTETRAIPKLDHVHTLVKTDAVAATCETVGNIEYWTCSKCGRLFSDETGTKEIEKADTVVAALGHDWDDGVITTAPTCTEAGVKSFVCQRDGSHTKTEPVSPTGHDWGEWEVTTAATCSAEGTETRVCKNDESHVETRAVAIDPEAHDWGEWTVTKAATEDEEGIETRVCKNDAEHTETRSIPKLDHVHTLVKTDAVAATCTEAGNIEYWTCSKCGRLFSDEAGTTEIEKANTVIAALGHAWDDGQIIAIATAEADGQIKYTCTRCGETRTESFAIEYTAPEIEAGDVGGKAVEDSLAAPILADAGYNEANIAYYEITMMVSLDNGKSFVPVTAETMPAEGIVVTIPYPTGTNAADYDFIVTHRLADSSVETLTPTESADGLKVTVKSFSPFAVGYKSVASSGGGTKAPDAGGTNGTNRSGSGSAAKTGDEQNPILWIAVALFCVLGIAAVIRKRNSYKPAHRK